MILMNPNRKKIVSIIMGKMEKPQMGPSHEDSPIDDSSMAKEHAAGKMIAAIKAEDKMALVMAMRDLFDIFDSEEDTAEEAEEAQ